MYERRDKWSVGEWMTPNPVTVEPDCPVKSAFYRMRADHFRHLIVVDKGELAGIVTDRDLRRPDISEAPDAWNETYQPDERYEVRYVMTTKVFTVTPQDPLEKALKMLLDNKIGALPVLDRNDRVIGILTYHDVLRAFDAALAANGNLLRHQPSGS